MGGEEDEDEDEDEDDEGEGGSTGFIERKASTSLEGAAEGGILLRLDH